MIEQLIAFSRDKSNRKYLCHKDILSFLLEINNIMIKRVQTHLNLNKV